MLGPTPIKARHLRKGDTVGLICPASPPFEAGVLEYSQEWLAKLGLKCKFGKHILSSYSDMAGTDEARLEDFHTMWSDPEVAAIIPVRGGHGSARLLPDIDFDLVKSNPKIFIGYSDLTALINPIYQRTGLITFHGPMATSFYSSSYSHHYFVKALMSNKPIGLIVDPLSKDVWRPLYPPPRMVIAEGKAQGPLAGGCLTLIRQLMGTPYELDCSGKILFLEDLEEEPHAIDRFLTQLLLTNKLQKARGIIVAEMIDCRPGESKRNVFSLNRSVEAILQERLSGLGIPVVYGMRFGHGKEQFTLPIGVEATLEASHKRVRFRIEQCATA